jgi:hypothetical protein
MTNETMAKACLILIQQGQITRVPCVDQSQPLPHVVMSTQMAVISDPFGPSAHLAPIPQMKRASQAGEPAKLTSYLYTPPTHRLLFRGSLSVPDSRLLLEGLSFTVPINDTRKSSVDLLQNPLALALESMRGRTLALSGTTRVDAVHLDKMAEVDV